MWKKRGEDGIEMEGTGEEGRRRVMEEEMKGWVTEERREQVRSGGEGEWKRR